MLEFRAGKSASLNRDDCDRGDFCVSESTCESKISSLRRALGVCLIILSVVNLLISILRLLGVYGAGRTGDDEK
jgi:hypothetical protein